MIFELLRLFGIVEIIELADAGGLRFANEAILHAYRNTSFFGDRLPAFVYNFRSFVIARQYPDDVALDRIVDDLNLEWYYEDDEHRRFGCRSLRERSSS